jgi:hypothetical protein
MRMILTMMHSKLKATNSSSRPPTIPAPLLSCPQQPHFSTD